MLTDSEQQMSNVIRRLSRSYMIMLRLTRGLLRTKSPSELLADISNEMSNMGKLISILSAKETSIQLEWSSKPPTQEGWYWLRDLDKTTSPKMVLVQQEKDGLYMIGPWELTRWALEVLKILGEWEWAGPIPEPEEPEE